MKRHHEHATCGIAPGNHNIDQHCFGRAWWTNKYGEIVGFYFSPILSHKDREMKGQPDDKSWLTNIELSKHLGKSCMGGFMAITSDLLGVSKQEPYIIYMWVYIYIQARQNLMTHRPGKRDTCISQQYSWYLVFAKCSATGGGKVIQRGNMMQKMVDACDQLTNMGTLWLHKWPANWDMSPSQIWLPRLQELDPLQAINLHQFIDSTVFG